MGVVITFIYLSRVIVRLNLLSVLRLHRECTGCVWIHEEIIKINNVAQVQDVDISMTI